MPKGKNLPSKKPSNKTAPKKVKKIEGVATPGEHEEEVAAEIFPAKEKVVVIELEERDDVVGPVDKMVADPLLEADAVSVDGVETDDADMDEEEIDPFGDKWEA